MGMQAFHTCISDSSTYKGYQHDITDPYIIFHILGTKFTEESESTTLTNAPSTCECGGMEKKE